jgi:hypothetical protein
MNKEIGADMTTNETLQNLATEATGDRSRQPGKEATHRASCLGELSWTALYPPIKGTEGSVMKRRKRRMGFTLLQALCHDLKKILMDGALTFLSRKDRRTLKKALQRRARKMPESLAHMSVQIQYLMVLRRIVERFAEAMELTSPSEFGSGITAGEGLPPGVPTDKR